MKSFLFFKNSFPVSRIEPGELWVKRLKAHFLSEKIQSMTPREIIDSIKAHPAKEMANEKLICDSVIEALNNAHGYILNSYQDTKNLYDTMDGFAHSIQLNKLRGIMKGYEESMHIIKEQVAKYEWWIKEGNFGYISDDYINEHL